MSKMEDIQSTKVIASGGLNSNVNHIYLSDNEPGSAVELQNFETSLWGGYRRINGHLPFDSDAEFIDNTGAEGRTLVTAFFGDQLIGARKQKAGNTYDFYVNAGGSWTKMTTTFSKSSLGVTRLRWKEYKFNGNSYVQFVDGINPSMVWNGTAWTQIKVGNTGADYDHAGGNQAIDSPNLITVFKNTVFIAKDALLVYATPLSPYDYTVASGSGQIPTGFDIQQIYPFRDELYVFGTTDIKKVVVSQDSTGASFFALQDVTSNIGCIAPDSVQELGGNLVFMSQDGLRPVAGTDRIGDTELETISKKVQQLLSDEIQTNDMSELCSVVIRNKTQVRFFFSDPAKAAIDTYGVIGCQKQDNSGNVGWEWMRLKGISAACTASKYIGAQEFVIFGGYDGSVHRMEVGNDFNGAAVEAIYSTPFLDFGDAGIRKTPRRIRLFLRPEGDMTITLQLVYDWADTSKLNPAAYAVDNKVDLLSTYGNAVYGVSLYSGITTPVLLQNVEGSGNSLQTKFITIDNNPPYTIQGMLYDYSVEGRK